MTEEERFQTVKNVYMNFEHEFAQRGMEDVAPIAASLTTAYMLYEVADILKRVPNAINHPALEETDFILYNKHDE